MYPELFTIRKAAWDGPPAQRVCGAAGSVSRSVPSSPVPLGQYGCAPVRLSAAGPRDTDNLLK